MCEDQEEDSTLVDREGGRGEALPVAGFIRSTGWGELWRELSRRVTGSDSAFQIPFWPPWGENGLEPVAGKAGSLVGRWVQDLEGSRGVTAGRKVDSGW